MDRQQPPVLKLAERLLLEIEGAVSRFSRDNRRGYGEDLRKSAFEVALRANKAWTDREDREHRIKLLEDSVDDIKLRLVLGKRLHAFSSFGQFESISRTARELGNQVGGWSRHSKKHLQGQSASSRVATQRASSLSTRATSNEVNL